VLGRRFYACDRCDAVHADVESPPACGRCGEDAFVVLQRDDAAAAYFHADG